MKNISGALGDYNKSIQLNPKHAESYFKRGLIYLNAKNYRMQSVIFQK